MGTSGTLRKLLKLILVDGDWAASFYKRTARAFREQVQEHNCSKIRRAYRATWFTVLLNEEANKTTETSLQSLKRKEMVELHMKTEQQERKVWSPSWGPKTRQRLFKKQKVKEKKWLKTTFTVNSFDGLFINFWASVLWDTSLTIKLAKADNWAMIDLH